MDDADRAAEFFEVEMAARRSIKKPELAYTGYCYNCLEPVEAPRKFCDEDCRTDYERRQKALSRY